MFALVDCNSFYASCEQIFRPELRNKPVVVLSNNDGCIVARSKEAKDLGIHGLQPFFKVEKYLRKHNVAIFSSNYPLYGDISGRIMRTLEPFSPNIEVYSIDEMFLSLAELDIDLREYSQEIKHKIYDHIRMPVSVGVAPTKTLAKLANHVAKKKRECNGVCILDAPYKWEWVLKRIPVTDIWGVAKKMALRLANLNIKTGYDLAIANPELVRRHCNIMIERTITELQGVSCFTLEDIPATKKQIYCTRSFGQKATCIKPVLEAVSLYAARASEKLRHQKHLVTQVHVFIHTSPFNANYYVASDTISLPYPTDDTRIITEYVRSLTKKLYRNGHEYLKAGIGFIDIIDKKKYQYDLFNSGQSAKAHKLMQTIDTINQVYGKNTLFLAAQGLSKPWYMRQQFTSPQYTTKWSDIPTVTNR